MSTAAVPRDNLILQRFLALFLFAGSCFFAIGTFVSAAKVVTGDMRTIGMLAGTGLPTWMLVWLGMALWSGRGLPRWFIAAFLLLVGFGSFILAFFCNTWEESLTLAAMAIPTAISIQPVLRTYLGKPAKPKTFDEL
ncbi:hypothetical protein OJF2_51590 [Aquisphaera giovannonii]|uniref:Uncharacterized protein n=1 Tax=Aquisphaera giovannonii TaxID=406548 RepID=A0A5B9W8Z2_9BACT|nr:hypothetical protein [Aquisphaera giovannonii]QEH36575.1 hypothetical protein OJF2_51590 [Aquisphaera giovannonii]